MRASVSPTSVLGRGVYGLADALRLINFRPGARPTGSNPVSRQTVTRWLRGYEFSNDRSLSRSPPLWHADYASENGPLEVSFRDLIELRFVRMFRDAGVSLDTIRQCFERAATLVKDERPFSTRRFRTDGRTIFLDIADGLQDDALVDLRQRQTVFRSFIAPSFLDLEFDADAVARWFPFGNGRRSIVVDPGFGFGRPISSAGRVPTEVLALAALVEGSIERAARAYEVPIASVRAAARFETLLAA